MMRSIIVSAIFALVLLMTACSDKPVLPAELPVPIVSFIQQTYPGQNITFAQKDLELTGWKYEVVLADNNSPSKIRGGREALMLPIKVICRCSTNAPALTGTPS